MEYKGDVKQISEKLKLTISNVYHRLGGKEGMADLREYGKF